MGKKHHIVPQFYLRYWAYNPEVPNSAMRTYIHSTTGKGYTGDSAIKDIFYQNHLYTLLDYPERDKNGEFDDQEIESKLADNEGKYSDFMKSFVKRVDLLADKQIENFLSIKDKIYLIGMFTGQFCRFKKELKDGEEALRRQLQKSRKGRLISNEQISNMVRELYVAPKNPPKDEPFIPSVGIGLFIYLICLPCAIGYTSTGDIITGNNPIHAINGKIYKSNHSNVGRIIYPLTPYLVLCFYPKKREYKISKRRKLFILSDEEVIEINKRIAMNSDRICSRLIFTEERLNQIYK